KNIIDIKQLQKWQAENRVVVIDVRANLQDKTAGRQAYEIGHIPGAYHLDLEDDLSSEAGQHGGNHPLPDMQAFAQTLGACGVTKDKKVVVYDEANDMF